MAQRLRISQLAKASGVAAKTIRYYEQVGVLPAPSRTASGYRQYDQVGVQRLRFVRRARSLGLPLRDVRALVLTMDGGPRPALRPRLRALVRRQLSSVRHQSAELRLLRRQLEQVLRRLPASSRGRPRDGCRCLEIAHGRDRISR